MPPPTDSYEPTAAQRRFTTTRDRRDGTLHVTSPTGVTRTTRPPGLRPPPQPPPDDPPEEPPPF